MVISKTAIASSFKKLLVVMLFAANSNSLFPEENYPPFYNEILKYNIEIKGFTVGTVLMKTMKTAGGLLQINAKIDSFEAIRGFYYVHGVIGALWDYKNQRSYIAYEDVYQGDTFQRRAYRYDKDKIVVSKHEKQFSEAGYPHTGPLKKNKKAKYIIKSTEYQDLLGIFYTMRSSGKRPVRGRVDEYKVLPSGVKKIMVTQVADIKRVDVPAFGGRKEIFHVKSGLRNPEKKGSKKKKKAEGGAIFIRTTSPVDMYITNDENQVPVLMWTDIPFFGRVYIVLESYTQF